MFYLINNFKNIYNTKILYKTMQYTNKQYLKDLFKKERKVDSENGIQMKNEAEQMRQIQKNRIGHE